jgi:hypothetical protein
VALQAALQDGGRLGFGKSRRIDEKGIRIGREIAAGGEFCHGHALQGKEAEGTLGTLNEEAMTITHSHEPSDGVLALQFRGANQHFKLAGTFTNGIPRRPSCSAEHAHAGRRRRPKGQSHARDECERADPSDHGWRTESDWHAIEIAERVPRSFFGFGINILITINYID